ncbi:hypothetical protein FB2170_17216 [Maribacter sp. HTCC2170]|nr:hypothetical protein FB2170_17216 [Maribacter sp. HTCC2170]
MKILSIKSDEKIFNFGLNLFTKESSNNQIKITDMKLVLISLLFLLTLQSVISQDFQGKAVYESKTQVNMDFGGRQIPEDRKKEIMERIKSASERSFTLIFNTAESIYKEEEKLEQPNTYNRRGMMFRMMSGGNGDYYKNIQEQKYLSKNELLGKIFLIEDSLPKLDWKMGSETKQIGNYTAFKATATKMIQRRNPRAFRPPGPGPEGNRKMNDDKEEKEEEVIEKEVQIVAWYTPEVPINHGPDEYWGLPGLILEVRDDITTIICSKIILNPKEKVDIKAPTKGKKVNQQEYNDISKKKMQEMRENFRNRRPPGDRRF